MPMSDYMRELREAVGNRLLEVPSVSVVLRDAKGRVLLVRHENDNAWTTPGGAVEPQETPADAALREMWEETGLQVRLDRVLGVYGGPEFVVDYRNGDRISYLMTVFEASDPSGTARPDGIETLELRYFGHDELERVSIPAWLPEIMDDVFADRSGTAFRQPTWRPFADA